MKILGIESSHDDTSIALVEDYKVVFNLKISQTELHKKFGGTVPELASREHVNNFTHLLHEIKDDIKDIDYIAYTKSPGLVGALQLGEIFAHSLSLSLNKPILPINHLQGHISSVLLYENKDKKPSPIMYPCISLLVSGGHTILYKQDHPDDDTIIGQTQDDAIGEVFDKVARSLNLGFPGGPIIDNIFKKNESQNNIYTLTTPNTSGEFDFSFSGLKTQVINIVNKQKNIDQKFQDDLSTSFQKISIDYLIQKTKLAIEKFKPKTIILSGGVSSNSYLREKFLTLHENAKIPKLKFSTDNGAMIASRAFVELESKK